MAFILLKWAYFQPFLAGVKKKRRFPVLTLDDVNGMGR